MTDPRIKVSAAVVGYLIALDALGAAGGIRTIDVARYLNIKKPSAHSMLGNLRDADIITKDAAGLSHLTLCGAELASRCQRYYGAVTDALTHALPPEADVQNAACVLVAELDEATLEKLCPKKGSE